jgi:hypothetical protein
MKKIGWVITLTVLTAACAVANHIGIRKVEPATCAGYHYETCSPVELGSRLTHDGCKWNVLGITLTKGETRLLLTGESGVISLPVSQLAVKP